MRLIDADALKTQIFEKCNGRGYMWTVIMGLIDKAPAIQPAEPQWIPVTERLPETSQDVLITKRKEFGTVRVMKAFYISSDDEGIWASERGTDTAGVIAWLPLPEPYKE